MTTGRPPKILRPIKMTLYLPEDLKAKLELHLFSAVEGRVPHGAYSTFIADRTREFFDASRTAVQIHEIQMQDQLQANRALAFEGLLTEIALTDLRTGWSEEKALSIIRRSRELTGKVPR